MNSKQIIFPLHGWIGIVLVVVFWYLNWSLDGLRTHLLFFPLWLGYALTVDGFVYYRKGNSLLSRNWKKYVLLFLISAPAWWLFELFNLRTQNWFYDGKQFFSELEYAIYATFSFSTVIPSVFGTAELVSTFKLINKIKFDKKIIPTKKFSILHFIIGLLLLTLVLLFPIIFFVFVWLSVFFILEPVNILLRKNSIYDYLKNGNWKPVFSLWIGCLVCGFFWEMWNYFSYPKWVYDIHFANFLYIFEMPILGYLGYIPFSFELLTIYSLLVGIFTKKEDNYIFSDQNN
ncbi:MAG: hypothetical protein KJN64_12360 [Ignavibacteria bacterium]|nr:hypothetical protein [Ignavibacteria bacterium]MBT8381314.1 hypothetical protein [Ignavibacteria bacterium]MBT8391287.1 hypothetical protein [Ignavibacteria bacterium]NNL20930.1 hypothetical protein [Ignavibacteriaceae bacterium]